MQGNGTQGWSTGIGIGMVTGGPVPTPISDYQAASDAWYRAREAADEALRLSNEASARLQMAQTEEQRAWAALENAAGRGVPVMPTVSKSIR